MKKIICLALAVLMLSALWVAASATGSGRAVLASSEKAQRGKPVAFSLTLSDCGEISGYTVELVYDKTIFQLEGATWQPQDKPFGIDSDVGTFALEAPQTPDHSPILTFTLLTNEKAPLDISTQVSCKVTVTTQSGEVAVSVSPVQLQITCPHDFQKNLTSDYLISPATCTEPAEYYKSCALCGAVDETQTFFSGTALSHNFKDREAPEYLAEPGDCQNRDIYYTSCVACGLKGEQTFEGRGYGDHVYDNNCDAKCNVCFAERQVSHQLSTDWISNSKGHWRVCIHCEEQRSYAKHTPGAAATAEAPQTCTVCGHVLKIYQEHVHQFGEEWFFDGEGHWHMCECGSGSVPGDHSWDASDPNLFVCSVCGATKIVEVVPQPTTPTAEQPEKSDSSVVLALGIMLILSLTGNMALLLVLNKKKARKKPKAQPTQEETSEIES